MGSATRLVKLALLGGGIAVVSALLLSSPSLAADDMSVNSRLHYGNAATYCGPDWAKGMVWLSNDPSNYYSEKVSVPFNSTEVKVEVRGALNTCATAMDDRRENRAFAGEVKSNTSELAITGTEFYRGNVPSEKTYTWTTKGSHLDALLDVDGVAACRGIAEIRYGTVQVKIYRKLIWEKVEYDGSVYRTEGGAGEEPIDVAIERHCPEVVQPKVTILGGDLLVRGDISTNATNLQGRYYGSWGEYGIAASGSIQGIASGSGYIGGVSALNDCSLHLLTFASSNGSGCPASVLGRYSKLPSSPAKTIVNEFTQLPKRDTLSGSVTLESLVSDTVYRATGNITLTSSTQLPKGKWAIILAENNTVRINSDLTYQNGTYASVDDIPQLVIVAKSIIIADTVNTVDAWLMAPEGTISTCDASGVSEPLGLSRNVCNERLSLTGPVSAQSLRLYRTTGSRALPGAAQPAESINMRADAYLWSLTLRAEDSRLRTMSTVELPPRF